MNKLLTDCVCTVYTKDIHVVTDRYHDNSFLVAVNHDGILNDVMAKVYSYRDKWYIWYPKRKYRKPVESFTRALLILEKEILKCLA